VQITSTAAQLARLGQKLSSLPAVDQNRAAEHQRVAAKLRAQERLVRIAELERTIAQRSVDRPEDSYTAELLALTEPGTASLADAAGFPFGPRPGGLPLWQGFVDYHGRILLGP